MENMMKKLLIGLLALGSLSSYAKYRDILFKNLTYPENSFIASCSDESCSKYIFQIDKEKFHKFRFELKRETLEGTIKNRRLDRGKTGHIRFKMTEKQLDLIKRKGEEAYYGKMVGASLALPFVAVANTVIAPFTAIGSIFDNSRKDSFKDKKAAKRIKRNIHSDIPEVIVRHKYYVEMVDYILAVGNKVLTDEYLDRLNILEITNLVKGMYKNCSPYTFNGNHTLLAFRNNNDDYSYHSYHNNYANTTRSGLEVLAVEIRRQCELK